ncbi:protoheme IX farnesyltransferase, mitochondrial-like [Ornithodoros turicata]|uniref:protoheme IX farnesyltransferase, mitochondrial-like n=1 Tax=Ornithodoros turicata TaxID=34597 RepID=UPI00313A4287
MLAISSPSLRTFVIKSKGCYKYCKNIYKLPPRNEYATSTGPKAALAEAVKVVEENTEATVPCPQAQALDSDVLDTHPNVKTGAIDSSPPLLFLRQSGKVVDLAGMSKDAKEFSLLHLRSEGNLVDLQPTHAAQSRREEPHPTASGPQWHRREIQLSRLPHYYMALSKIRLTALVVTTTVAGYAMAPGLLDPTVLLYATVGTALTSCAANAVNQFLEVPYDSQMNRTKNRVLVKGILSPLHAFSFAVVSGTLGVSMLCGGVNGLTGALGAANLLLYTCCYTPLKRCSIVNTWVGSVVGAIPPMMGWAACTGYLDLGAWVLGAILYSWQFPHFNALSWNLRPDYSRAGYRMMSVTHPALCRVTALRHSVALLALCSVAAPLSGLTTWTFAVGSAPLNAYLVHRAWRFYSDADSASSRALFRLSLVYLPALILLMYVAKDRSKKESTAMKAKII